MVGWLAAINLLKWPHEVYLLLLDSFDVESNCGFAFSRIRMNEEI